MTKKKPGIFDPWRQEAPPPPEPTQAQPVDDPLDAVGGGSMPTRFQARRGGLVVWLPEDDNHERVAAQAKTNILVALETLMADRDLFVVFTNWKISSAPQTHDGYTKISNGPRSVYVDGDYDNAIEAITFAFREAARTKPSAETYLTSLGIRPYIR